MYRLLVADLSVPQDGRRISPSTVHMYPLAEAGIDRVAAKVDQDVKVMRDEIKRDDDRRDAAGGTGRFAAGHEPVHDVEEEEADGEDDDEDDSPSGVKVAG